MLSLGKYFDLEHDVGAQLSKVSVCTARSNLKIVGQEKSGRILFAFDSVIYKELGDSKSSTTVTHIACYEASRSSIQILCILEKKTYIVQASVNQDLTLLAFVTKCKMKKDDSSKCQSTHVYQYEGMVAEISPQNRIFSLNLAGINLIRLQFLYIRRPQITAEKMTHLLVFVHMKHIGLYSFPMGQAGDDVVVLRDQPAMHELANKFVWAQWDAIHLQLFYVQLRKTSAKPNCRVAMLFCKQFHDEKPLELVLSDMVVDLFPGINEPPIKSDKTRSVYQYDDYTALNENIKEKGLNMQVLSHANGMVFVCHQHIPNQMETSKTEQAELTYSILILHLGKLVRCTCKVEQVSTRVKLNFVLYHDYILVFAVGVLTHLLDLGLEHVSDHHIIDNNCSESDATTNATEANQGIFATFQSSGNDPCFYDYKQNVAYKVTINKDKLAHLFAKTDTYQTRLAILHYCTVHDRQMSVFKKLLQYICNDVCSTEVTEILSEFLLSSTYYSMKKQVDANILKLLPFTTLTNVEKHASPMQEYTNKNTLLSFFPFDDVLESVAPPSARPQHLKKPDTWINLHNHVNDVCKHGSPTPFSIGTIKEHIYSIMTNLTQHSGANHDERLEQDRRFLSPVFRQESNGRKSPTVTSLEQCFPAAPQECDERSHLAMSTCVDKLVEHLKTHSQVSSDTKIHNLAVEYVMCQRQQSHYLCQQLCIAAGVELQGFVQLKKHASRPERKLFYLLERYALVAIDLSFPFPNGFPSYFTMLGFICMNFSLFMQYVHRDVFKITPYFVRAIFSELPDDRKSAEVKLRVLSLLPQDDVEQYCKTWKHPIAEKFQAHKVVEAACNTETEGTGVSSGDCRETSHFRPLDVLLHRIAPIVPASDLTLVHKVAISNTRNEFETIQAAWKEFSQK